MGRDEVGEVEGDRGRGPGGGGAEEDRIADALDEPAPRPGDELVGLLLEGVDGGPEVGGAELAGPLGVADEVAEPDREVERAEALSSCVTRLRSTASSKWRR